MKHLLAVVIVCTLWQSISKEQEKLQGKWGSIWFVHFVLLWKGASCGRQSRGRTRLGGRGRVWHQPCCNCVLWQLLFRVYYHMVQTLLQLFPTVYHYLVAFLHSVLLFGRAVYYHMVAFLRCVLWYDANPTAAFSILSYGTHHLYCSFSPRCIIIWPNQSYCSIRNPLHCEAFPHCVFYTKRPEKDPKGLSIVISLWQVSKSQKMMKPNHFWKGY